MLPPMSTHPTLVRAAARLAPAMPNGFVPQVEACLARPEGSPLTFTPDTNLVIALAALLVTTVGVAWTIAQDIRSQGHEPTPIVVERRVRLEMTIPPDLPASKVDRILSVTIEEVIRQAAA